MVDEDEKLKEQYQDFSPNAAEYQKAPMNFNHERDMVTPMEFLKEQLARGEITVNEYMIISQALSS